MIGKNTNRVDILGVGIDPLELKEVLHRVEKFIVSEEKKTINYANVYTVNIASKDIKYREILNSADLLYCDGYGIVLGSKITGKQLPGRMTGADWIYNLGAFCQEKGFAIYLLGSKPGVAEKAARRLQSIYPALKISGFHHGYLTDEQKVSEVIQRINSSKPDILLVGMGSPLQEKFIHKNRRKIDVSVCWSVGALFDYVAGVVPRAPKWMLDNGLEWLFRLFYEPGRMWNRYLVGNTIFLLRVFGVSLKKNLINH
jgi:N-acetylglucosaminyldiphosphoundecaprenol N-acetyl-beta-D-mannosaminyltransferase